ncbi:traB domain-containing protein-like [Hydractinia symbiolongicarpus]|uniref:traB domain-containing protein-like n=1 Tax=Hydractinia symbiolongicarpus TaxID=13093 RepID=UPI00254E5BB1|nr:traB domain-containing protein-like [Hydractinia symbiolongicarpus]
MSDKEDVGLSSPKSNHFAEEEEKVEDDNSVFTNGDIENEYDFGSASSRRESDEDSWETVSEEMRAEAMEHENEGQCCCNACSMKSMMLSTRLQNRSEYLDTSLPENVTKVVTETGSSIYVVGTAHFSEASQDDVKRVIQYLSPDVVMVELCPSRVGVLKYNEEELLKAAQDVSLAKLKMAIKDSGSVISGVMQLLLLSMSAHITKQLGMAPGGEFRVAAKQAKEIPGCRLVLGDRPIQATLGRAMASLSVFQKIKLGWHLLFSKDNITKEDVEKYKQKDMIAEMLAEMTGDFPELSRVFVEERDQYMAQMLVHCANMVKNDLPAYIYLNNGSESSREKDKSSKNIEDEEQEPAKQSKEAGDERVVKKDGKSCEEENSEKTVESISRSDYNPVIVGVVGIGHMNGVIENIGKEVDMNALNEVPPPSYANRAFKMALKAAVVAAVSWGVYSVINWVKS